MRWTSSSGSTPSGEGPADADQLSKNVEGDGIQIMSFDQGYASMNAPTKRLEQLMLNGQLAHGGHPVLRWMANNVSLETDAADNWKPSKKRSRERIDGIVAMIMGLSLAQDNPIDPEATPWGFYV